MKLSFIAPTDPSAGALGIVNYVAQLTKELSKTHDMAFISFKKLYPFMKFPKQPSPFTGRTKIHNILSTYHPSTWLKARIIINDIKPDVIHFHWWSSVLNPTYIALLRLLREYKTVITCHNPVSHERSFPFCSLDRLNKIMLNLTDNAIVDTFGAEATLTKIHQKLKCKITIIPAGNLISYSDANTVSDKEAKAKLGLDTDTPCLLFFGYVRKYKGLPYLIRAIKGVNCHLIIAGKFVDPLEKYVKLIERRGIKGQIRIFPYVIPENRVTLLFKAADVVVLPYVSFSSASGVAQSAIALGKCIIATRCTGFNEVFSHGVNAYLVPPRDSKSLREAITELIHRPTKMREMGRNARKLAESYKWSKIAEMHTDLYKNLLEK